MIFVFWSCADLWLMIIQQVVLFSVTSAAPWKLHVFLYLNIPVRWRSVSDWSNLTAARWHQRRPPSVSLSSLAHLVASSPLVNYSPLLCLITVTQLLSIPLFVLRPLLFSLFSQTLSVSPGLFNWCRLVVVVCVSGRRRVKRTRSLLLLTTCLTLQLQHHPPAPSREQTLRDQIYVFYCYHDGSVGTQSVFKL